MVGTLCAICIVTYIVLNIYILTTPYYVAFIGALLTSDASLLYRLTSLKMLYLFKMLQLLLEVLYLQMFEFPGGCAEAGGMLKLQNDRHVHNPQ